MELGVVKVVNGLDPARVRSSICSTQPAGTIKGLVSPNVPVFELTRRQGNDPRLVWTLYRLFRRESPDVVHTHAWGTLVEGLLAARLARVPVVVHGEHGTLQLRGYQKRIQRRAWSAADCVLSVSSRLAARMADETGLAPERIRTIRNGVDLSRFGQSDRAAARRALDLPPDAAVVATVGRLVPVKDHLMLFEAWARLHPQHAGAVLLLPGEGPLRGALEARVSALGLGGRVRFLGHRPDVEGVLAAADVFVLSSESEGLSNTILEAMAAGLPVVATRVGGADEMVVDGETGLLVPPRTPDGMSFALAALLSAPALCRAMGAAGRARAESEFSLESMVRRYEELYVEVTGAGAIGPAALARKVERRTGAA
jgi:sugar transferase (PEP-CTERM/EpsH1 system associated)